MGEGGETERQRDREREREGQRQRECVCGCVWEGGRQSGTLLSLEHGSLEGCLRAIWLKPQSTQ